MSLPRVRLAPLSEPNDTSQLELATTADAAAAVAKLNAQLGAERAALAARGRNGGRLERVQSALRRLRNPELAAYWSAGDIVLSEPFGARPSVIARAPWAVARELVGKLLRRVPPRELVEALAGFGEDALRRALASGIRIKIVPTSRDFALCSPSVAELVHLHQSPQAPRQARAVGRPAGGAFRLRTAARVVATPCAAHGRRARVRPCAGCRLGRAAEIVLFV